MSFACSEQSMFHGTSKLLSKKDKIYITLQVSITADNAWVSIDIHDNFNEDVNMHSILMKRLTRI